MKINVLGTKYELLYRSPKEDRELAGWDGYCDPNNQKMVVNTRCSNLYNAVRYVLLQAFMCESNIYSVDTDLMEWFVDKFPELLEAFKDADVL